MRSFHVSVTKCRIGGISYRTMLEYDLSYKKPTLVQRCPPYVTLFIKVQASTVKKRESVAVCNTLW